MKNLVATGFLLVLIGCGGAPSESEDTASEGEATTRTTYVDITDFGSLDQGAWYDAAAKLNATFSADCASTFCQTTFSNLTPLTFNCSVTSKAGDVHDCAWTFAGSRESVDPHTAVTTTDAPTYQCHVHPATTATKLLAFLSSSSDPLHAPLPGGTASISDSVGACFADPLGATTLPTPVVGRASYVPASAYYTSASGEAPWQKALVAAKGGFDDVCGDTFCGSDYGDLQSLELDCAVTKSTGEVKSCTWAFAGSYSLPGSGGALAVTSKSFVCKVAMRGTLHELIGVLTAAGTDNPIQRALPGETTSLYDAISNDCLP